MKTRLGPKDRIVPFPVVLVVCGTLKRPNIITVGKVGIVASDPPVIGISIRKTRHSLDLIRANGEFSVNTPSSGQCAQADYCGIVSGRNGEKITAVGMTPLRGTRISAPILDECPYNLECRVVREIALGDWVLFLAEVLETLVDEDKLLDPETGRIDIEKIDPIVYLGSANEYRRLGDVVGRGFQEGRCLVRE